jgi:hypothetical protein
MSSDGGGKPNRGPRSGGGKGSNNIGTQKISKLLGLKRVEGAAMFGGSGCDLVVQIQATGNVTTKYVPAGKAAELMACADDTSIMGIPGKILKMSETEGKGDLACRRLESLLMKASIVGINIEGRWVHSMVNLQSLRSKLSEKVELIRKVRDNSIYLASIRKYDDAQEAAKKLPKTFRAIVNGLNHVAGHIYHHEIGDIHTYMSGGPVVRNYNQYSLWMVERVKKELSPDQRNKSILDYVFSKSCLPYVTTGELCVTRLQTVTVVLTGIFRSKTHFDRDTINNGNQMIPKDDWDALGAIGNASLIPPHLQGILKTKLYSTNLTVSPESYLDKIFSIMSKSAIPKKENELDKRVELYHLEWLNTVNGTMNLAIGQAGFIAKNELLANALGNVTLSLQNPKLSGVPPKSQMKENMAIQTAKPGYGYLIPRVIKNTWNNGVDEKDRLINLLDKSTAA